MTILQSSIVPSSGYLISRSLRFNSADSANLSRTPASAGNRTTWTWNAWIKRCNPGTRGFLFSAGTNAGTDIDGIEFNTDALRVFSYSGSFIFDVSTNALFRDPSAWYMITVAYDSTQATNTNRVKVYVNSTQQTFASATYPSQNANTDNINNTVAHYFGTSISSNYFNGYLTEINFIDGQALTPSSFGQTNASTGVWEPIKYTGTYGTNGFYLPFSDNSSVNALGLDQSVNTSGSSDTAPVTLGTNGTGWTGYGVRQVIPASGLIWSSNGAKCRVKLTGGSSGLTVVGCAIGKQAASGNAWDFDGNQVSVTFSGSSSVTIGADTTVYSDWITFSISTANTYVVGMAISNSGTNTVQRGTNTSFVSYDKVGGYTDATSTAPSGYSTSPSNTILFAGLELQANNWKPNNFSVTAGAGNDSLVDTPTSYGTDTGAGGEVRGNYATLNPLNQNSTGVTLANGNLDVTRSSASFGQVWSTIGMSSGKWYVECLVGDTTNFNLGLANGNMIGANRYVGQDANTWGYDPNGQKVNSATYTNYGNTYANGDTIGIAFDADAGALYFYKNGAVQNSGTAAFTGLTSGPYFFTCGVENSTTANSWNFGQRAFANTAPSGYKALCTQNLPTPTIGATSTTQANDYFNVVLYPGTGSSQSITGVGFQPDFVWIKEREVGTADHGLYDAVRGVQKQLESNSNGQESTETTGLTAFGTDGFTVGALAQLNTNTDKYVAWNWNAGGSNATNTSGTITSTVRANTTAGFSIVTYTGNGVDGATVGHGLGVTPAMVIQKRRNGNIGGWRVWHTAIYGTSGVTDTLILNTTAASGADSDNISGVSSTTFTTRGTGATNPNGNDCVAYVFVAISGYSAFGSITGNGSTDGPFCYLGFRPAFVMLKRTDSTSNWTILDFQREGYNVDNDPLYPNLSDAEGTADLADLLSNGFKLRSTDTSVNANGGTYVYAAFAQNPFKFSLAR